jgi:hypothetical protein
MFSSLYAISIDKASGIVICRVPFGIIIGTYPRVFQASEGKVQDQRICWKLEQLADGLRA